jgi:hypothetical protein
MIRFNRVVIASLLLLVMVTGCNNDQADQSVVSTPVVVKKKAPKPKAAPKASASASPGDDTTPATAASPGKAKTPTTAANNTPAKKPKAASPAKAKTVAAVKDGAKPTLVKLKGYLPAAVQALQADDIAQAKQYAQDFNANWKQNIIQYSVKNTSQPAHKKLSAGVAQVNNNLIKPATPDKAKAIAALQSLSKAVDEYTKSP